MDIVAVLALSVSCISIGAVGAVWSDFRFRSKALLADLGEKVDEFDSVTAKASQANLSLAAKIADLEKKIETISFHAMSQKRG